MSLLQTYMTFLLKIFFFYLPDLSRYRMSPLLSLTAKVLNKLVNMYYLLSPSPSGHPSDTGSLMCPSLSIVTDLLKVLGVMSLRPRLSLLLPVDVPTILNTLTRPILKLPIAALCGSPDSLSKSCQTLVPHPPPSPCLHTWPLHPLFYTNFTHFST